MVAVVTDSASNIPPELARAHRIEVAPLHLFLGDEEYRDGVDLTPADFYARLVTDRARASTAAPSPGDFLDAFQRSGADEIVCVCVAADMSASCNNARLAAARSEARVEVVDSKSASMAQGFVALEAARAAAMGASLDDVAGRARRLAAEATLVATIETFEFLRRSGRVNALQAFAGTRLGLQPVFRFRRGSAAGVARPRTRERALARVVETSLAEIGSRPVHLAAFHAAAPRDAEALLESIAASAQVIEQLVVEVTPVVGAHTGPGLAGSAFVCDEAKLRP
jgi:DegV family protein with EDD domain